VQSTSITSKQPGYYCQVCDCVVKDSVNYLDHINGKKHQRALGMSMKVERSTIDQVRSKLASLKAKKEEASVQYDFDARIEELQRQEEEDKRRKREKKKAKRNAKKDNKDETIVEDEIDPEMAAMMGFSGFGSQKKP